MIGSISLLATISARVFSSTPAMRPSINRAPSAWPGKCQRAIYHQGVYAVAATFRQLYEMIEVEDERVHRRVAAATAAHLRRIEQLTARIRRLEEELAGKVRQVHQLDLAVRELNKQLKEARRQTRQAQERHLAHLMKDSHNSSLPPSQDRRKRTRSLREKSGKKPG